ncbi:MAG: ABC transporter permease [Hyphomicrobiales bacterium]
MTQAVIRPHETSPRRPLAFDWRSLSPYIALALLMALGTAVNIDFLTLENVSNVVARSAFIAIIAVGATFVISGGGLDLSVGSMAAFVAGVTILFLNRAGPDASYGTLAAGMVLALALGGLCGLGNGLIVAFGRIEPFIVTLGTMGIFRALITYLAQGGSIPMKSATLRELYRPAYFGAVVGIPVPVLVFVGVAVIAAVVLYKTPFGRRVTAIGSSEEVARYSGLAIKRVRVLTYVIQGLCVGLAVIVYVPRLGSATPTTGLLWELQAITAVVIGGTALRGGTGRVFGTIAGAIILEMVGNIMVLSDLVSEYLIGAVQGAIIIVAMLVQRSLARSR